MSGMTVDDILKLIGGQDVVRAYLRGVDPGSETDKDAQRAMRAAIGTVRAAGVHDVMAAAEPDLYGQACLLLCRMWTDAEDAAAAGIAAQYNAVVLLLRTDPRNCADAPQ